MAWRAGERNVKALSRKLACYKVLHFATHVLPAGESEAVLKAKATPELILTPPKDGMPAGEALFTASEMAQLQLDADQMGRKRRPMATLRIARENS